MKPLNRHKHTLVFIGFGMITGVILRRRNRLPRLIAQYPGLSLGISFILGGITSIWYVSYLQTTENYKLPSIPNGIIRKWDSSARNLTEVFGKRNRGAIKWEWPSRPIKKTTAKARYQKIWKYHSENPNVTLEQVGEIVLMVPTRACSFPSMSELQEAKNRHRLAL
jgi:hypothetical protein